MGDSGYNDGDPWNGGKLIGDIHATGPSGVARMRHLRAIGKMAKAEDRPRVWATVADFRTLAERRVHWAWARVFFAVGMAFTISLRISDVAGPSNIWGV